MPTKHTPGPWSVNSYISVRDDSSPTGRRKSLCATADTADGHLISAAHRTVAEIISGRNRSADARLIAAAPEMYAALTAILDDGDLFLARLVRAKIDNA